MKRKSAIIVAILIMCVGFAAISTTLIINGSAKVGENTEDFSVIFTKASLDGTDVYTIEWKWIDSSNDTEIGNNAENVVYNLMINVTGEKE